MGFCVAKTTKTGGSAQVARSIVTCRSCMASSRADCVFAGARLISSRQQEIRENRPAHKPEFLRLEVEDARPCDIRGHEVRRELNALKFAGHRARQRLHQQSFPHAGNAFDQRMPARQQRHQREINRFVLADNHAAQRLSNAPRAARDRRDAQPSLAFPRSRTAPARLNPVHGSSFMRFMPPRESSSAKREL